MITDEHLQAAASALTHHTGLSASGAAVARLESRLRERSDALDTGIDDYLGILRGDPDEAQNLVDHLTVQETSFFRDHAHFDALIRRVLPTHSGPVVIWSAGCATGQEPYSLAMALDEARIDDFHVVATDISRPAVERVRAAQYRESELRGLSAARRGRYLTQVDDRWEIEPGLRDRVSVQHHNLLTDPVPVAARNAAAVFCRNVFIYLERTRIAPFLVDVRDHLAPGGVVFVGASESLWSVPDGYTLTRLGEAFCYRRTEEERSDTPATGLDPAPRPPRPAPRKKRRPAAEVTQVSEVDRHRQEVYRSPGDALAHLRLGLSLEAAGDAPAGQRAFRAARAALERGHLDQVEIGLEGYDIGALRTMLDVKLGEEDPCPS